MGRWVFGLGLALTACNGWVAARPEVPADVGLAALVEVTSDGRVVAATPLTPWGDNLPVISRRSAGTLLVGFAEDQFDGYGVGMDALVGASLRQASGCDNALPPPRFAAQVGDGIVDPIAISDVPALTADFTALGCQDLETHTYAVDPTCEAEVCVPVARSRQPCVLELDLQTCGGGKVVITQDPLTSELCGTVEDRGCAPADDGYADLSFDCEPGPPACRLHVYRDARRRPQPFELASVKWRSGPPSIPGTVLDRPWIPVRFLRSGYGLDMEMLDGRLIISSPTDPEQRCNLPADFYSVDTETLETIDVVSGPICPTALSADPSGQTFVAAYHDEQTWRIARFDARGMEIQTAIAVDETLSDRETWRPASAFRPQGTGEIWLTMINRVDFDPLPATVLIRFDEQTLARRTQQILPGWHRSYTGILTENEPRFALLAEWSRSVGWFDPNGTDFPLPSATVPVPMDSPIKNQYYTLTLIAEDRVIVGALGRAPAIFASPSGDLRPIAHPGGEVEQMMVRFLPWTTNEWLGVGLQTLNGGRREAILTRVDVQSERFVPGVWVIGDGMPTIAKTDAQGRHFVLLPWTAELVRISPRNN